MVEGDDIDHSNLELLMQRRDILHGKASVTSLMSERGSYAEYLWMLKGCLIQEGIFSGKEIVTIDYTRSFALRLASRIAHTRVHVRARTNAESLNFKRILEHIAEEQKEEDREGESLPSRT